MRIPDLTPLTDPEIYQPPLPEIMTPQEPEPLRHEEPHAPERVKED
ncbi:hypothetical protein [Laceyella sacchari]|jgi:hypothetical protein|uniref:Uncharacterized protein n=1 Tax=Laceyella sacchari TaxID=37482 RepID=A0ABY5U1U8_LACSH|nr:hypothetical protein [Laceyella sacchari]UWE02995.1 hypothetical protein NYR52_12805 [Laceyella sacchari]